MSCVFLFLTETSTYALSKPAPAKDVHTSLVPVDEVVNLRDFGASGDGVADDGPALQSALDALATAGGGTLFVPAGRYAIITPVQKNFAGLASSITIQGVTSTTTVPPPTALGSELTRGLDLVSEFAPQTGSQNVAISIGGLQQFAVKDVVFIGTPDVTTDALVTLGLINIDEALIHHCEFYGLSSLVAGGSIVLAIRSRLTIDQTVFLGPTTSSGVNSPIVQNLEWKGLVVSDSVFADYGQRSELFGKMGYAAPYSWINIGNAAAVTPDSPRREAILRNVFLDEGGFNGISSTPNSFEPTSAPIDLLYITGLYMNVSNLDASGHYLSNLRNVIIEKSHYGWSHNSDAAINFTGVGEAILDEVKCVADADTIRADGTTGNLTVINSTYTHLESQAQNTRVIEFAPEDDPVQHVRKRFMDELGRAPDAAAHFYWSNQLLQCQQDSGCLADRKVALKAYLEQSPEPLFSISGRVITETGAARPGVTVTISGSQNVVTLTDNNGHYHFSGLPTSGTYTVTPTITPQMSLSLVTPAADVVADFGSAQTHHVISGRVLDATGNPLTGATVALSGSESATVLTDDTGNYSFRNLRTGGAYIVTARKTSYEFVPSAKIYNTLSADQTLDFAADFVTYTISGKVVNASNEGIAGVNLALSGSQTRTTTSNNTGDFQFPDVPSEGNYTIEPSRIGLVFTSPPKTYDSLDSNKYVALTGTVVNHSISGRVTDSDGTGVTNATVTFSGHTAGAVTTNANGDYIIDGLPRGADYTLTVSHVHYAFSKSSRTFSNLTSDHASDFNGVRRRHTVSGRVTEGEAGLSGVTVTLSGSENATVITADDGTYSFTNLPAGGNFAVAPAKLGDVFGPMDISFNDLSGNQTANFTKTGTTPILIIEENTLRAASLRSATLMRDPFSIVSSPYFNSDQQTRVMLFALNLKLAPGEDAASVTVQLEDSQHRVFNLPAEFVGQVPQFDWMTQIVIKLTDELGAGDFQVSISYSGKNSNRALLTIR